MFELLPQVFGRPTPWRFKQNSPGGGQKQLDAINAINSPTPQLRGLIKTKKTRPSGFKSLGKVLASLWQRPDRILDKQIDSDLKDVREVERLI